MAKTPRVIIAGAGPVGLLAAQAFSNLGIESRVYEKRLKSDTTNGIAIPNIAGSTFSYSAPPPWGSRDRTRALALHGSVVDAIRQLTNIDFLHDSGLYQVNTLIGAIDGNYASNHFPDQLGWWRSAASSFLGARSPDHVLTAAEVRSSICGEPPVAMVGIAEVEHFLLQSNLDVQFGVEVIGAQAADKEHKVAVHVRDRSGTVMVTNADLLLIATSGGAFHLAGLKQRGSSNTPSGDSLLADLGYSLIEHLPGAVWLQDIAWTVPSVNIKKRLAVYGQTGFGSYTGVAADFPDFSKVTVALPEALANDADGQMEWVHAVATAMDVKYEGREVVFQGRYLAFQSQLSSIVSPRSPFILAIGDAYARTTPMNGRNFQTSVPLLLDLMALLREQDDILNSPTEWLQRLGQIELEQGDFMSQILEDSDQIGRPIDDLAFQSQRAAFSV